MKYRGTMITAILLHVLSFCVKFETKYLLSYMNCCKNTKNKDHVRELLRGSITATECPVLLINGSCSGWAAYFKQRVYHVQCIC